MRYLGKERFLPVRSREEGTVSVEFVVLFPLLTLIVVSMLEFGHLWMVRHTLTIASREGARAAVIFVPGTDAERAALAIQVARDRVNQYLRDTIPSWSDDVIVDEPTVNLSAAGTLTGGTLTVRVHTDNALLVLHKLITDIPVWAVTTMRFE